MHGPFSPFKVNHQALHQALEYNDDSLFLLKLCDLEKGHGHKKAVWPPNASYRLSPCTVSNNLLKYHPTPQKKTTTKKKQQKKQTNKQTTEPTNVPVKVEVCQLSALKSITLT